MGKRKEKRPKLIISEVILSKGRTVTEAGVYRESSSESEGVSMLMRLEVSPGMEVKEGESFSVTAKQIIEEGKTVAAGMILSKTEDEEALPSPKEPEVKLLSKRTRKRSQRK